MYKKLDDFFLYLNSNDQLNKLFRKKKTREQNGNKILIKIYSKQCRNLINIL